MASDERGAEHAILDPKGDILVVVDQSHEFLVSSKALTLTSEYFQTLLSLKFKEGIEFASHNAANGPFLIHLKDDHPATMLLLFQILHHQCDTESTLPETTRLLDLAVTADKYLCARAVRPFLSNWIDRQLEGPYRDAQLQLMAAAYLIRSPRAFQKMTNQAILNWRRSFLDFATTHDPHGLLPTQVYLKMEYLRSESWHEIMAEIDDMYHTALSKGCGRLETDQHAMSLNSEAYASLGDMAAHGALQLVLLDRGVIVAGGPIDSRPSLAHAMKELREITTVEIQERMGSLSSDRLSKAFKSFPSAVRQVCKDVEKLCEGLCLDCVQSSLSDGGVWHCRLHPRYLGHR